MQSEKLRPVPGWERPGLEVEPHLGVTGSPATQRVTAILHDTGTKAAHSPKPSPGGEAPAPGQGPRLPWLPEGSPAGEVSSPEVSSPVSGQTVGGARHFVWRTGDGEEGSRLPDPEGASWVCPGHPCPPAAGPSAGSGPCPLSGSIPQVQPPQVLCSWSPPPETPGPRPLPEPLLAQASLLLEPFADTPASIRSRVHAHMALCTSFYSTDPNLELI